MDKQVKNRMETAGGLEYRDIWGLGARQVKFFLMRRKVNPLWLPRT